MRGQAAVLLVAGLCAVAIGTFVVGAIAHGLGTRAAAQRTADLAALAGARAMHDAYPRLFVAPRERRHLDKPAYLALGRAAALEVVRANGGGTAQVTFPDAASLAPVRIRVEVLRRLTVRRRRARASTGLAATAVATLDPAATDYGPTGGAGEYPGPFAERQGRRMRPDVAQAFDRLQAAARADGLTLVITSAFRSDAEQAALFAAHPDPKWVAPPGHSLHRYGTELDLGPPSAYGWLHTHAPEFHLVQRYAWEPWHFGLDRNVASRPRAADADGAAPGRALPSFVPARYARPIAQAAQRYNVAAALLAAQLYAESGFNPFARSRAGALGIAQFMPGTARQYGLPDPFDAPAAIDAQARMMRDLLRQFASVPLALAAYNAGAERVAACACIPPIAETQGYVAQILGLMGGAGDAPPALTVRLVA